MAASGQQAPPFPAPQDQDLKNIIDKLANFVARNGTKFEEMTMSKQKDNPKFSFLFGGDHYNYYKWKVSSEIAHHKNSPNQGTFASAQAAQQALVQSIQSAPWQQHEQQPSGVPSQEQEYASQTDINIQDFENHLAKIMQSCTKDNISNGKHWIFKHCKVAEQFRKIAEYMLLRITGPGMNFLHKLHIIYLINDVLHHSSRKQTYDVIPVFKEVIVHIYCSTFVGETEENQQRLKKVIRIWETNNYFDSEIIEKMKNADKQKDLESSSVDASNITHDPYRNDRFDEQSKGTYQEITNHKSNDTIIDEENENKEIHTQENQQSSNDQSIVSRIENVSPPMTITTIPATSNTPIDKPVVNQFEHPQPPPVENIPFNQLPSHQNYPFPPGNFPYEHPPDFHRFPPPGFPRPQFNQPPPGFNAPVPPFDPAFAPRPPPQMGHPLRPPQQFDYNHGFTDHPPSGVHEFHHGQPVVGPPIMNEPPPPLVPQAMYYELPAGLMVPLINEKDVDYNSLNPAEIKLPPPQPPSERLLAAIEAFYAPPSHERPRNSDGWEAGALHEFYKIKLPFMKQREVREKIEKVKEMAQKKVEPKDSTETEESVRAPSPAKSPRRSKSPSPRRRSHSRSPPRRRSRSISKSRSRSPRRRRSRSNSRSKSRSRSRSRSPRRRRSPAHDRHSPRRRSPTPPSFAGGYMQQSLNTRIDETNVGHQLLKKMGWEGSGLGKSEQGIQDPIKQGDIRDKQDMYKGVGVNINDPFTQYRKNMSYTYNRPRRSRR